MFLAREEACSKSCNMPQLHCQGRDLPTCFKTVLQDRASDASYIYGSIRTDFRNCMQLPWVHSSGKLPPFSSVCPKSFLYFLFQIPFLAETEAPNTPGNVLRKRLPVVCYNCLAVYERFSFWKICRTDTWHVNFEETQSVIQTVCQVLCGHVDARYDWLLFY